MDKKLAKKVATKFFYWWWNTKGTNTEEGFEDWWENHGGKHIK